MPDGAVAVLRYYRTGLAHPAYSIPRPHSLSSAARVRCCRHIPPREKRNHEKNRLRLSNPRRRSLCSRRVARRGPWCAHLARPGTGRGRAETGPRREAPPRQPGLLRWRGGLEPVGDRRPRDLVQGHRRQRALPHLCLPATGRRAGRLVSCPARGPARRPFRRVRPDQRSRLLHPRHGRLPGEEPRRDLRPRLVSRRRGAAEVRGPRGLSRSGVRLPRPGSRPERPPQRQEGSAPVRLRPRVRHLDRRARLPQVPEPALRRRSLAEAERQPRELGRLRENGIGRSEVLGCTRSPTRRRLGRAAVPDRHLVRLVPHRIRPAQPAGRSRASQVGKHQGRDRQPVSADFRAPRLRHALRLARVPDVLARPAGHVRHLGDPDRPGVEPGDDQRHPQLQPAAGLQG